MNVRVAITGFGRVGRCFLRSAYQRQSPIEVVAINDVADPATLAALLRHDSVYGRFPASVNSDGDALTVGDARIPVFAEADPASLPWRDLEVDLVIESTGRYRTRAGAQRHLDAGARKVVITAPAKGDDPVDANLVLGVNFDEVYDPDRHHIVTNASCTTNCLAPVAKVLHERFGIERGLMVTIHAYTADQGLVDAPHKDLRRARAGAMSMIPTSTGAARAIGLVLPELKGKLDGYAMRVPTADVSAVDLSVQLKSQADAASLNAAMKEAAAGPLKGILEYCDEPLVSVDFIGDTHSSIFDAMSTKVMGGTFAKVLAWYDNEMGYAARCADLALLMGR
jgi:glyceraldehyde 3-phosphate dehydrogenase